MQGPPLGRIGITTMRRTAALVLLTSGAMVASPAGVVMQAQAQDTAARHDLAKQKPDRSGAMEPGTDKPYFRLNAEDRQAFVAKVQTLKLGDSRQSVESLLGKPWSDQRATTKEKRKFIGRFVDYYLTKHSKETVNEKLDEWVMLKFDGKDHLVKVVSRAADIPSLP